ncbi:hypothetical protein PHLGIDRAFT_124576 [Phlebiopsis gigantea 11061_1 CR5-6]|uniref:C2H2-type domain-containing protein n=1 Tax=Phlebiopsis gigantea (strain 11061_1 CR5-6) TaxID=745531 RepID=A0A0C3S653_PHLG1|nr:hypothetical protein PHLGIDRAFT_124576 [Phlebiopsis gigantea 11061_1 CR5-6]
MPVSYAPGTLVLETETMDDLYVQTPGSSKKKYTGRPYSCKLCHQRIVGQSPNEHYRLHHQPNARIRYPDQKRAVELKRSATTDMFECPRCSASFRSPRHIQDHATSWDGKCIHSDTSGSLVKTSQQTARRTNAMKTPTKQSARRTNVVETPPKQARRRRAAHSSLIQQSKTVARPLKTPTRTRTGIPQISRTFRAMIRQYYNQRTMSNKEIAEFCNCDVRDVHFAVNNESGDNLEEDQAYLDGQLGDLINIDDFELEGYDEVTGAFQVDMKTEVDVDMIPGEELAQPTFVDQSASRTKAYPTPDSDAPPGQAQDEVLDSEDEIERNYIRVAASPEPDAEPSHQIETGVKSTRRRPRTHDRLLEVSTVAPRAQLNSRKAPPKDPIYAFVLSLDGFTPDIVKDITSVIKAYGVTTAGDLDQLSDMEEYWGDVRQYLCNQGLKQHHWELIRDGLRARLEALRR